MRVRAVSPTTPSWIIQDFYTLQTVAVLDGVPTVDTPVTGDLEEGCNRWEGTWKVDTSRTPSSVPGCF